MKIHARIASILQVLVLMAMLLAPPAAVAAQFDYTSYARMLDSVVTEGQQVKGITLNTVDYDRLHSEARDPSSDYARVLGQLASFDPETLPSIQDKVAFWINAYNIGAIKMVLDHYPVDSIRSMKISLFKNPWNRTVLTVNGKRYSLGEIEHDILLGNYGQKMVHFSIVCASLSCPDLSRQVYRGSTLAQQMERQARQFLAKRSKGMIIDREKRTVSVSRIFKFDKKNFGRGKEDIVPFILPFLAAEDAEYLRAGNYVLEFLAYDWDLNIRQQVTAGPGDR